MLKVCSSSCCLSSTSNILCSLPFAFQLVSPLSLSSILSFTFPSFTSKKSKTREYIIQNIHWEQERLDKSTNNQLKDLINSQKHPEANFTAPNLPKTTSWLIRNKALSPEFNNVEDEAELGNMMGNDGEKLLELVDDIRQIDSLRNEELHIPQVHLTRMKLYMSLT